MSLNLHFMALEHLKLPCSVPSSGKTMMRNLYSGSANEDHDVRHLSQHLSYKCLNNGTYYTSNMYYLGLKCVH